MSTLAIVAMVGIALFTVGGIMRRDGISWEIDPTVASASEECMIRRRRGNHNRLGFVVQRCYVGSPGRLLAVGETPCAPIPAMAQRNKSPDGQISSVQNSRISLWNFNFRVIALTRRKDFSLLSSSKR